MTNNNYIIRNAVAEDADALATLGRTTFLAAFQSNNDIDQIHRYVGQAFSLEQMTLEVDDPKAHFLVTERDDELLAYAKLLECEAPDCVGSSKSIQLERIYVSASLTGTGIGSELMRKVVTLAYSLSYQSIWLGAWEENTSAIRFYERAGYRAVGEKIFMMDNDAQRDLVMLHHL